MNVTFYGKEDNQVSGNHAVLMGQCQGSLNFTELSNSVEVRDNSWSVSITTQPCVLEWKWKLDDQWDLDQQDNRITEIPDTANHVAVYSKFNIRGGEYTDILVMHEERGRRAG